MTDENKFIGVGHGSQEIAESGKVGSACKVGRNPDFAVKLKGFGEDFRCLHSTNLWTRYDASGIDFHFLQGGGNVTESFSTTASQVALLVRQFGRAFHCLGMSYQVEFQNDPRNVFVFLYQSVAQIQPLTSENISWNCNRRVAVTIQHFFT